MLISLKSFKNKTHNSAAIAHDFACKILVIKTAIYGINVMKIFKVWKKPQPKQRMNMIMNNDKTEAKPLCVHTYTLRIW